MAGRRMLVLLDNARDAEQVRPLLPGNPDCLVVVTNRNQLPGLVTTEGAQPLALHLLTSDEARELREQQGRLSDALDHALRALDLFRSSGHRQGWRMRSTRSAGSRSRSVPPRRRSATAGRRSGCWRALGDRRGEANTWDSLGYAHHHLGEHPAAVDWYQRAIDLYQELGDRYFLADTLTHLAETWLAAGDRPAARASWGRSLEILDELGQPGRGHGASSAARRLTAAHRFAVPARRSSADSTFSPAAGSTPRRRQCRRGERV